MVKVCANLIRETKDAYLLSFTFKHKSFDQSKLKDIYKPHVNKFNWEIWLPKKDCKALSLRRGFYGIKDNLFKIIEKRITVDVGITHEKVFSFSNFKELFSSIKLSREALAVYNAYLQEEVSGNSFITTEGRQLYEDVPAWNEAWDNWRY